VRAGFVAVLPAAPGRDEVPRPSDFGSDLYGEGVRRSRSVRGKTVRPCPAEGVEDRAGQGQVAGAAQGLEDLRQAVT
jgi:hypothetical protein